MQEMLNVPYCLCLLLDCFDLIVLSGLQERLLALSRRARRALERELHVSHQQRGSSGSALNRSSSALAQPGQGISRAGPPPQDGQGTSRDASRPQEGPQALGRGAARQEGPQARQKELSDRALKILEELNALGRQVGPRSAHPSHPQQLRTDTQSLASSHTLLLLQPPVPSCRYAS